MKNIINALFILFLLGCSVNSQTNNIEKQQEKKISEFQFVGEYERINSSDFEQKNKMNSFVFIKSNNGKDYKIEFLSGHGKTSFNAWKDKTDLIMPIFDVSKEEAIKSSNYWILTEDNDTLIVNNKSPDSNATFKFKRKK